VSGVTALKLQ